jgi:hypothetical protein
MPRGARQGKLGREAERRAWTKHIEGAAAEEPRKSKYGNQRSAGYASKREAAMAAKLQALAKAGVIWEYKEQVRFVIAEGDGIEPGVSYVADFVYRDSIGLHVLDAKGAKTYVYKLKKRLLWLLHKIKIEEV